MLDSGPADAAPERAAAVSTVRGELSRGSADYDNGPALTQQIRPDEQAEIDAAMAAALLGSQPSQPSQPDVSGGEGASATKPPKIGRANDVGGDESHGEGAMTTSTTGPTDDEIAAALDLVSDLNAEFFQ